MQINNIKTLTLLLCSLFFCYKVNAQSIERVEAPINTEKNISVTIKLPPKGFDLESQLSNGHELIYLPPNEQEANSTQKIAVRLFPQQNVTAEEMKEKLKAHHENQCTAYTVVIKQKKEGGEKTVSSSEKISTSKILLEKINDLKDYQTIEVGMICKIQDEENLVYARYYVGPNRVAEIEYKKNISTSDKPEKVLEDMSAFISSFVQIKN